jgi:hypothetical protein
MTLNPAICNVRFCLKARWISSLSTASLNTSHQRLLSNDAPFNGPCPDSAREAATGASDFLKSGPTIIERHPATDTKSIHTTSETALGVVNSIANRLIHDGNVSGDRLSFLTRALLWDPEIGRGNPVAKLTGIP